MTNLIKSNHAKVRQQQRHITDAALESFYLNMVLKKDKGGGVQLFI